MALALGSWTRAPSTGTALWWALPAGGAIAPAAGWPSAGSARALSAQRWLATLATKPPAAVAPTRALAAGGWPWAPVPASPLRLPSLSVDVHGELPRRVTLEKLGTARRAPAATRERRRRRAGRASSIGATEETGTSEFLMVAGEVGERSTHPPEGKGLGEGMGWGAGRGGKAEEVLKTPGGVRGGKGTGGGGGSGRESAQPIPLRVEPSCTRCRPGIFSFEWGTCGDDCS